MPCREARRLANQRAATLNAMTHDLPGEPGLVPSRLDEAVARHTANLVAAYHPEGGHQHWLLAQAADAAARLDACQVAMRAAQDDQMDRADLCWDIDQEAAIEALAARLPGNPARVSRQLRQSAHGCRWLLARLEALKAPLVEDGVWDEAQCDRVAQLLGIGPDTRDAHPYFRPGADLAGLIELVSDQVAVLQGPLVEALDPLDAKERELTSLGIPLRPSKELLRLQRNETKLRRILNESLAEFRRLRAEGYAGPELITGLVEPATVAEPPRPPSSPHAAIPDPPSEEPELTREEAVAPLTDRPVMSKSATMLDTVQSNLAGQAAPEKARSTPPSKPTDRKARRKREQAARKRARSH